MVQCAERLEPVLNSLKKKNHASQKATETTLKFSFTVH